VFAKQLLKKAQQRLAPLSALIVYGLAAAPAHAAGSGMPWEEPLSVILESITGPVAEIIAVLAIAITGLTLAFGDSSGGFRKLIQIVFGISIAFAATTLVLDFFGFTGGATITSAVLNA
jgi:type IV secretion system protein VirB2